jgi:LmbE family N-acetylglucosaminyl deacetylase
VKGWSILVFTLLLCEMRVAAQEAKPLPAADERYKADILVVVAHPDDEGAATPYLARAIHDEHKRVAVVFATRGGSGGNDYTREHGPALADTREQEARQACAALGITNVWFLDGKDTASQNILNSLANWGHGANLEALVRIVRLTRPEVILTWLPAIFIGENHGDHQASGVLATESFDMAGDPIVFPSQVAGASKRLEPYLENLTPWQPKKIYYFADASNDKQFAGKGPAYSVREVSPSQKKPYWRMAIDAAKPHLTQFPEAIHQFAAMSDAELEKAMSDPEHGWWSEPMTLIFGKSIVATQPWEAIFPDVEPRQKELSPPVETYSGPRPGFENSTLKLELGEPWAFYAKFWPAHRLPEFKPAHGPEIAIKAGSIVGVPLIISRKPGAAREIAIKMNVPSGWKVVSGIGKFVLPDEERIYTRVELQSPDLNERDLKERAADGLIVSGTAGNELFGEVGLRVLLRSSALPQ